MAAARTTATVEVPTRPEVREPLAPELKAELLTQVEERGQVTVHCMLTTGFADCIRIWPSTYLLCRHSGHRSKLLHAEGIPYAPIWKAVAPDSRVEFTLLFEPLPDHCILFDLVEEIEDPGGFFSPAILRNDLDVYRVEV